MRSTKREKGNVAICRTQGADRQIAGSGGRSATYGTRQCNRGDPRQNRRVRLDGPGPGLRRRSTARAPAEEGAAAAEVSGSEVGQYVERARQAAQVDCRQEPRAVSDRAGLVASPLSPMKAF